MIEQEGTVSLWVGHAASAQAFDEALMSAYSEDGDFLSSPFGRAFNLGWYDEDFLEAGCMEDPMPSLRDGLAGCSYENDVVAPLEALPESKLQHDENCFVLLYDMRYDGAVSRWSEDGVSLRFVGSARYR